MSYLKTDISVDDKRFADFLDITISEFQNSPWMPNSDEIRVKYLGIFNPEYVKHDEDGYPIFTLAQKEFLDALFKSYLYGYILGLINMGIYIAFDRFSIGKIQQCLHNKDLISYLDAQVDYVYKKHPEYQKCSAKVFKKSGIFNHFMSEFRDKSKKAAVKKVGAELLDKSVEYKLIPFLLAKFFDFTNIGKIVGPMNPVTKKRVVSNLLKSGNIKELKYLFSKPLKIIASRFGLSLCLGSVFEQAIVYRDTVMLVGLEYGPTGFSFVNLRIVSVKDGDKLVQTQIRNPPKNLFKPSKESFKKIMRQIANKPRRSVKEELEKFGSKQN